MNALPIPNKSFAYLALAAAGLLLLGTTYRAASLLLDGNTEIGSAEANSKISVAQTQTRQKKEYGQIAKWHLFGTAPTKAEKDAKAPPVKAPETRLKLELLGVFYDENTKEGWAIIAEPGKPHKTFRVGDKLPGDATLYALETQRIILSRNNRHETLTLKQLKSNQRDSSPRTRPPRMPIAKPPSKRRKIAI